MLYYLSLFFGCWNEWQLTTFLLCIWIIYTLSQFADVGASLTAAAAFLARSKWSRLSRAPSSPDHSPLFAALCHRALPHLQKVLQINPQEVKKKTSSSASAYNANIAKTQPQSSGSKAKGIKLKIHSSRMFALKFCLQRAPLQIDFYVSFPRPQVIQKGWSGHALLSNIHKFPVKGHLLTL